MVWTGRRRSSSPRAVSLESLEGRSLFHGGGFEAFINFQPAGAEVPVGYAADTGAVYGDRGNGLSYGWNLSTAALTRERNASNSPDQRYDTLTSMQRSGYGSAWEIAVPNGSYSVRVVAGDAAAYDSTYAIAAEGVTVVAGKPTSTVKWFDGTQTVTVADGRLTLTNAAGSANNKVCFVDLHQLDAPSDLPLVSVTAADPSAAETAPGETPNGGSFIVSRTGDTTQPLTVNYTLGGSATAGTDYAPLSGAVTIPAGATSATVNVDVLDDPAPEGSETVVLALAASAQYDVDTPAAATVTVADNDAPPPLTFEAHVNFQPAGSPVPIGYVADAGAVFADRGNGLAYGWDLSTASLARDRNSTASADQRYDTLTSMQRSGFGSVWELAVPNGTYTVHLVAGDAGGYDSTYAIAAEGITVVAGKPTSSVRWFEGTKTVNVSDGRLTLTNAAGSANNKVCFVDVVGQASGPALPIVTVSASDASASETAGNSGGFTVSRTGPTDEPLVVNLTVGGGATSGTDYAALGTSVTIPAGASSAALTVRPVDDLVVEGAETVTLAAAPNAAYVVGSSSPATVTIADNDAAPGTTLSWSSVASISVGRSEAMGATVNGKLYLFGGYVDTTFKPTSRGDVYDPVANKWTQVASLPFGISHMGTVAVGDSIYFAGGYPATSTNQTFSTTAVWRYDTITNQFTDLPKLPAARGGGALAAVGRVLHFFGGSDAARKDAAQHWQLDLDNPAGGWIAKAPLPVATNHVAGVTFGGKVYAIGGQQNQDSAAIQRAEVQVYDPATDKWTARAPLPLARSHITSSTFVRDGKILVLGGLGPGNRVISRVDSYDPVADKWTQLTGLPSGRLSGVSDVLPDGRIIFATGSMAKNTWVGSFA
jgi:N-acetylneuraminic acid mutarotase